jgi:predicted dehydrogenase
MAEYIRWGIIGCGSIAAKFAEGLKSVPGSILSAVASRSEQKARRFGEKWKAEHCYGSYKALAADPVVDVVYIATPHPMHMENSMLCLNAGKAVLCEKPFTVNSAQAKDVVNLARSRGLFLMEAMWTRFLPSITKLREILSQGLIGDIRLLQATARIQGSLIRSLGAAPCLMWVYTMFHLPPWFSAGSRHVFQVLHI